MKRSPVLTDVISAILVLLFFYTALSKIIDYHAFQFALHSSPLLKPYGAVMVWVVPTVELVAVTLLVIPSLKLTGLWVAAFLLAGFTGYIGYTLASATVLPCSCGGVLQSLSWPQHFCFNLFFLALSIAGILLYRKQHKAMKDTPP